MLQKIVNSELKSQTKDVEKSLAEVRQCHTKILDSQHTIMEMKNEVRDMLNEMKQDPITCIHMIHKTSMIGQEQVLDKGKILNPENGGIKPS